MKKIISAIMSLSLLAGVAAMPAAAAETYSLGDVDMNGVVDTRDAVMVAREYLHMIMQYDFADDAAAIATEGHELTVEQLAYADIDSDGYVDASDGTAILQYYIFNLVKPSLLSSEEFFTRLLEEGHDSLVDLCGPDDYQSTGEQVVEDYRRTGG